MSENTSGEGYVTAVDGRGEPGAGEDTSGSEYVQSSEHGDPDAPEAGTGYVSAVDDRGRRDAGEDTSGEGFVRED